MEKYCRKTCNLCGDSSVAPPPITYCSLLSPCQNGGTCLDDGVDWYKCLCPAPYSGTDCEIIDDCLKDQPIMCHTWAAQGECCINNDYMMKNCKVACGQCEVPKKQLDCKCSDDVNQQCEKRAQNGECCRDPEMLKTCKKSCSQCGAIKKVPGCPCMDNHQHCQLWKEDGQCEENPGFMNRWCKKSCGVCEINSEIDENCKDKANWCKFFTMDCKPTSQNYPTMKELCKKTCNLCEAALGPAAVISDEILVPKEYHLTMEEVSGSADPGNRLGNEAE